MKLDLSARYHLAQRVAAAAGRLAGRTRAAGMRVTSKGRLDLVTDADFAAERAIRRAIARAFPGDVCVGEELGGTAGEAYWLIDPVDGTNNFAFGLPLWVVSIAFVVGGQPAIGVIYEPAARALYAARRGRGAWLGDQRLRVRKTRALEGAMIAVGTSRRTKAATFFRQLRRLDAAGADFRRVGSAALALAWVAAGRFDAYYEAHLNPWDAAAGLLLVEEAGGDPGDFFAPGSTGRVLAGARPLTALLEPLLGRRSAG